MSKLLKIIGALALPLLVAAGCTERSVPAAGPAVNSASSPSSPKSNASESTEKPATEIADATSSSTVSPPAVPAAAAVRDISFDDIKLKIKNNDEYSREKLSERVKKLDGQPIRIRGYIFPTYSEKVEQFVLVRDNMQCCFGPGAALYDCIFVKMNGDKSATYTDRPVTVDGTFKVDEILNPDGSGKFVAIYQLSGDAVK